MKRIGVVLLAFVLACSPMKTAWQPNTVSLIGDCPKQANCTIELLPNKSLIVETSAYGLKYSLADQTGMNVVIFKFDKIIKGDLQDAGYREEIVFEYDGKRNIDLTDSQLQTSKMLFGRFCYCKGQTGYYRVKKGRLSIDQNARAKLDLTISEVPQLTKQIQFALK
jgi:hypothetical protein